MDFYVVLCEFDMHVIYCELMWQRIGGVGGWFWDLRGYRMVWLGPRRSQVAFWMLFPHSAFKRRLTGKSTGEHKKSTGGKTMFYRRPTGGGREQFWLF